MYVTLARALVGASSAIPLVIGLIHLAYTFRGPKLTPRDVEVQQSMSVATPVLTRETTMWKAWIGFNASHALGIILFGILYGYLVLVQPAFFFRSTFLMALGFAVLASYLVLAKLYWFSVPLRLIAVALVAYAAGVIVAVCA